MQIVVNQERDEVQEEKPDPWLVSSKQEAPFKDPETVEVRGSVKRVELPVIKKEMQDVPEELSVETVPIVTGELSKKVKVEKKEVDEPGETKAQEEVKEQTDTVIKEKDKEDVQTESSLDPETEHSILKLRKLSKNNIESERKRSMDLEAVAKTPITPDSNDDFVFSDEDEPFDVPDISIC